MKKRKDIFILFLIIIGLFILSFIMLGVYNPHKKNKNSKGVVLNIKKDTFDIIGSLAVTDKYGRTIVDDSLDSNVFVEFEVKNKSEHKKNYQIFITRKDDKSEQIPGAYIKFYLTDLKDNPLDQYNGNKLPNYDELKYLNDDSASKLIYEGSLKHRTSTKYRLRVWIDDTYDISTGDSSFSFKIGVREV